MSRCVQVIPSGEVIRLAAVLSPPPMATKRLNGEDHATSVKNNAAGLVRVVHVMPSGDVMIFVPPIVAVATATRRCSSGDHVTADHSRALAAVLAVHVMPSGLVTTPALGAKASATATSRPSSGAQTTSNRALTPPGNVRDVHVVPSGEVMTYGENEEKATAQNNCSSGAHVIEIP